MSSPPAAVVFDHTALLALGAGSRMLSGLVSQAHLRPGRYIFAPALCLAAAIAQRPGIADHIGVLPALQIIDLDYPAAAAVGGFIAAGLDWRAAQTRSQARTSSCARMCSTPSTRSSRPEPTSNPVTSSSPTQH